MRQSIAAASLIRKEQDGHFFWLARWSRSWQRFHLVGGHKRPEESFRECLVREISEELGLTEHADYEMAAESTAHLRIHRVVGRGEGRDRLHDGIVRR